MLTRRTTSHRTRAVPRATRMGGGVAALVVAVLAFSLGSPRAEAVPVAVPIIIGAVSLAYGAYGDYQNDGDLQDATRKILRAIEDAKDEIIAELNTIADSQATSCAEARIGQFANIGSWTRTTKEIFANEVDLCLTTIKNYIRDLSEPKSVDKLGFALNALGPIVLAAYAHLGFPDTEIIAKLKEGNKKIKSRLSRRRRSRRIRSAGATPRTSPATRSPVSRSRPP